MAQVTRKKSRGKIGDAIGDCGLTVQGWLEQLGILTCTQDVEQYYKKILDKNNTTKEEIEEIFTNVQKVDADYVEKILELIYVGNLLIKYITDMTDSIDPDGGKIDIGKLTELLESDKEELENAQLVVVKTLVEDDELEDATEYVEAVVSYKLTYDEFEALSEEEQQMVIKSAYKLDYKSLSASVDSDGMSASETWNNVEVGLKGKIDGTMLLSGVITNGESKMCRCNGMRRWKFR